jgi:hypothetical protein
MDLASFPPVEKFYEPGAVHIQMFMIITNIVETSVFRVNACGDSELEFTCYTSITTGRGPSRDRRKQPR